ncbi:DUF1549 and DUF1553 domain-containing protein [Rosistilla oblonga]|uniref:DUF1549 and DUF1553 domain-containing protein n=1 Tax=Rosistilla oblonga TaxID=2527990 RepID=UPI003A987F3C
MLLRLSIALLLIVAARSLPAQSPEFAVDVMSVLSKAGCNLGTCHGNLNGKGGLKLSLRGQSPRDDFRTLVEEARGRRVNVLAPDASLILQKATGTAAHRGGIRFDADSQEYRVIKEWLQQGAPAPSPDAAHVVQLDVTPPEAVVAAPQTDLQLKVIAQLSDGTSRDVTDRACYELSNLIAEISPGGRVTRLAQGETTLIVRYLNMQVPVSIAFIDARPEFVWDAPPSSNPIDRLVWDKLKRLRINPSPLCDDNVFIRRAFLDAIGRAPTATEAQQFASDTRSDKRRRLIDELLSRTEFADYWALKWADVLRTEEKVLDVNGVEIFHGWIRDAIASGRPWTEFVSDLVTGVGSTYDQPAANYYRANRDPATRGETTARLFLGTRLQCAKCHNHPFDHWTQSDYYQWSSLFSQLDYELGDNKRKDKLDKNEFVGEQVVLVSKQAEVKNPTTGKIAPPKFLGGPTLDEKARKDRLQSVADWLTTEDNELFAQSQVNFIWYHLMGIGLVDPIDDFRLTNPASNPPLMRYLADHFVQQNFDLRAVVREIMNSQTYQLSALPNATNSHDQTSYSHAIVRRLPAEVLLDLQSDVLDDPAAFDGYPKGIRATQIPGVQKRRKRDARLQLGDRFLKTFGKPERILACDCERSNETTLKQVFMLIGEGLNQRLASRSNRIARLAASDLSGAEIADELYWTALTRPPSDAERQRAAQLIDNASDRRTAVEDLAWALLNAKEFLFRR